MSAQPSPEPVYLICKKCGRRKPITFFAKKGFYRICIACLTRFMK